MDREFYERGENGMNSRCAHYSSVPLRNRFGKVRSVRCSPARLGNPFHVPHDQRRRQLNRAETSVGLRSSSKSTAPTDLTPVDPCILLVEHIRPSDGLLRCIREIEIIHAAGPSRLHPEFEKTGWACRRPRPAASHEPLPRRSP